LQKSNRASVLNIDLEYKDYLFLNLTGRNDWTSVLSKENNNFSTQVLGIFHTNFSL
jgi:hypothetical protein